MFQVFRRNFRTDMNFEVINVISIQFKIDILIQILILFKY